MTNLTALIFQIIGLHKFPVSPSGWDINENILSEEVTTEYGITEKDVAGAPGLSSAIRQFDSLARDVMAGGENLTLLTDGQLHLRQCLWPEVTRKNLSLPPYFSRFHDLRKEFQSLQPTDPAGEHLTVEDMLKSLDLEEDDSQETALRTVNNMAAVVLSLLGQGRRLHCPEEIRQNLEPGIRSRSEQVSQTVPDWSSFIGRAPIILRSHWSRASLVMLAPVILCHKEPDNHIQSPLPLVAMKNQQGAVGGIGSPSWFFIIYCRILPA